MTGPEHYKAEPRAVTDAREVLAAAEAAIPSGDLGVARWWGRLEAALEDILLHIGAEAGRAPLVEPAAEPVAVKAARRVLAASIEASVTGDPIDPARWWGRLEAALKILLDHIDQDNGQDDEDDEGAELETARDRIARVHAVLAGATWRYAMVRAADVRAALTGADEGPPLAETIAAAMIKYNFPPTEWPDGPPGEGERDRARREADAIVRAIAGSPEPTPEAGQ